METFKVVIDGIDLSDKDRKRIEDGIHRSMLEVFADDEGGDGDGTGGGIDFFPVHPRQVKRVHPGRPNGEILVRVGFDEKELQSLLEQEFGRDASLGAVRASMDVPSRLSVSDIAARGALGEKARGEIPGGEAP